MTKAYSKLVPGVWFDLVVEAPDEHGMLPVFIHTPEGEGYTVVHKDSISPVELTVVPESIPDVLWGVAYGDPAAPTLEVYFTEREAKMASSVVPTKRLWGYFPLHVERNSMIPV